MTHGPADRDRDLTPARPYVLPSIDAALPAAVRPRRSSRLFPRPRLMLAIGLALVFVTAAVGMTLTGGSRKAVDMVGLPTAPAPTDAWSKPSMEPDSSSEPALLEPSLGESPSSAHAEGSPVVALQSPHNTQPAPTPVPSTPKPTKTPQPGRALVSHESGKCLRASGVDGSPVQLWTCDGSAQQRWTIFADGTIRSNGLCLATAGGATANGTTIQVATCNGTAAQRFQLNAAADIVNLPADRCVDVRDHGTADGTSIQLWDCGGTDNQKWTLS